VVEYHTALPALLAGVDLYVQLVVQQASRVAGTEEATATARLCTVERVN
jgi:hypothetical protein